MAMDIKAFHALELENGETCIISTDKRQMARWYALDYLKEKPLPTEKGYRAIVADGYRFTPAFRKKET
ncbi:MAG: hypothetical protein NC321_14230 [Clostridium sp.]|nr:hypothetical protein [Clostridium sp.]